MVGGLRCVVIHVKCDPNRLRGYGAVESRKWPFPITLASGLYNSLYYRTSRDNTPMGRHSLLVLNVPLNTNEPTNQRGRELEIHAR